MMNENNNFNNGMNSNPGMPAEPNMGMNPNPGMPAEPNMGMNPNPGMPTPVVAQPAKQGNKKLLVIIGIVIAVVAVVSVVIALLLGGNKTLTCKQEQSLGMGMAMNASVDFNFNGKNVQNANMNIEVDLGNYGSFKDTFIKQFEEEYASFAEKGLNVEITSDDSKIYIKFKADRQKFEAAGLSTSGTYKEVKSDMETQGFVCE